MRRIFGVIVLLAIFAGTIIIWAAPEKQETAFELFLFNLRQDMEFLADEVYGIGERPENWTYEPVLGSEIPVLDFDSPTLVPDLWFDGEKLADAVFGDDVRPPEWFGATSTVPQILARNVRHDLELTADEFFGSALRPPEWGGAASIFRCDRTLQNFVRIVEDIYGETLTTPDGSLSYCQTASRAAVVELLPLVIEDDGGLENVNALALALRGDLERLADELLGLGARPQDWVGNVQETSPTLLEDINTDLERLARDEFGPDQRPPEWLPFIPNAPSTSYLNLRSNLELLTERLITGEGARPNGWQGLTDDPLSQCTVIERGLLELAQDEYAFTLDQTLFETQNYCEVITFTVNSVVEAPREQVVEESSRFRAESNFAFAYLDVAALEYMGVMPGGTEFRAWYRNFQESNMMFVSGDDFALFIDRRYTTLSEDVFNTLETLEGRRPLTFCDATWCNGPGPTPTPTGFGPLAAVINDATPPPTAAVGDDGVISTEKTQVSWNNVRVTYLQDTPENNTAQVALEICQEPEQITCEPVISVFDNNLGIAKPVLYLSPTGLNVYEFGYGYTTNLVIESESLISTDVFISDPTIR
jgi:hypothetical protein